MFCYTKAGYFFGFSTTHFYKHVRLNGTAFKYTKVRHMLNLVQELTIHSNLTLIA